MTKDELTRKLFFNLFFCWGLLLCNPALLSTPLVMYNLKIVLEWCGLDMASLVLRFEGRMEKFLETLVAIVCGFL